MIFSVIIFFIMIYYYSVPDNNEPLKDSNYSTSPKVDNFIDDIINDGTSRPKEGLSIYIGKSVEKLISDFGEPNRKDPSAYGYEWWIYNNFSGTYMQAGIIDGSVVTVYGIGNQLNVAPFLIGQTIEEIYRSTLLETEIMVATKRGTYRFELSEEDLNIRPLVQLGDIFAQLSIDKYTGTLSSIRFYDKKTLISHRPYEMAYRGDFIQSSEPTEEEWQAIEKGSEQQIYDITNVIRGRFDLDALAWDNNVAEVAYGHSKDMYEHGYFAHESPQFGDLAARLAANDIHYQAAGENIASDYNDGPAAVEGWLNSEGHRKALLEKDYSSLGVGVFQKYYTQNFIQNK
ncbi:CAP domain-containing protein [Lederbergia citrea]|uniref:CAP domain-containing protein n=1 Tax=Lederbergia citrea TaxID=2833581 RepID=UPI001BCA08C1|nr:CAP domain-containing protein [Lederbergia citrea]MBS4177243.1 CAP domain-containing protein [Lederbergia citrea]